MANKYKRAPLWYKDAIIYELNIKGFKDSTGNGIGDFNGLISKLDYLQDLGVSAVWILPFYPSPLRDDGYDISDYYTISPAYGQLDDFKRLLDAAHERNLKIITELVINHTSDQHPWFQRARTAAPGSVERDYYVWSDDPNKYKDVRIIFQDFEASNWTWDPVAKAYYWHRFYSHQPDLNFDNPVVQEEIFKILDYWVQMGIDGFRLDAIPYLFEREQTNCENLPETHQFLKKLRKYIDDNYDDVLFLAEANMWPEDSASYFGEGDECHMNYHFPLMPRMYMSLKMEDRHPITDIFEQTPAIPENCQWAMFLRNHDELTLEMVTDEERDYMRKNYAADPKARINLGIRRRLAPLLDNDRKRIELLNVLLFSFPGTPVLYYGDEIGMGDNYYLGDRDGVRTPMQWNANQNAGFSEANPQSLYLPVIIDPEYDYKYVNVENQQRNTNSLLWWTKRVIATRQRYKAFGRGNIQFLNPSNSKVLAFTRQHEEEQILVVANFSRFVEGVYLDLAAFENYTPIEIFGDSKFPVIEESPYFLTLSPYGYYWFELKPAEMLELTEAMLQSPPMIADTVLEVTRLEIFRQKVLPRFFRKVSWFANKDKSIEEVRVMDAMPLQLEEMEYVLLIIEVRFRTGTPELFQLPITFKEATAEDDDVWRKEEVVGIARVNGVEGVIIDAMYDTDYQLAILNKADTFLNSNSIHVDWKQPLEVVSEATVKRSTVQYLSIAYKEGYFVKLYRRIDDQPNPDFEINYWLTERNKVDFVPQVLGSITYKKRHYYSSLAIVQPLINHQGYGWDYVLDAVKRLMEQLEISSYDFETVKANKFTAVDYENFDDALKLLLPLSFVQRMELFAKRTAQLHLALLPVGKDPAFEPELFSLHYQRSLFSALKSLARISFSALRNNYNAIPEADRPKAQQLLGSKAKLLDWMKRIYIHKFDAIKIRIHGNLNLEQVMLYNEDILIDDFDGTYDRPFSERKLRKSPLVDVASVLQSVHYALHRTAKEQLQDETAQKVASWWYETVASTFLTSYQAEIKDANIPDFIPSNEQDFQILVEVFILERALKELYYEINARPDWAVIPIESILKLIGA